MTTVKTRKKLIEVALPLEAINFASAKEKSIRHGHPSTLHLYWARRPLAAARAIIFAQMVDDPSANPELFPSAKAQDKERKRLFKVIEDLVQWENTTNEDVLSAAREEILVSWRRACADNADHPKAKVIFDRNKLPGFHDPFAGGGALPLEAQRLGFESYATDLNPVAVLINKAMIEIPPLFCGRPPVNPEWTSKHDQQKAMNIWKGLQGLADDVRYYGNWMQEEAQRRIGHLYPQVTITEEMTVGRPDLLQHTNKNFKVITWIWARTVKSPNPAFADVQVPIVSSFMLSAKDGKEAYIKPVLTARGYEFEVKVGKPDDVEMVKNGTKHGAGANFRCLISNAPITADYIREEGQAQRIGAKLMAIVLEGDRGRIYISPNKSHEDIALNAKPGWSPDVEFFQQALGFRIGNYGMSKWSDLFTSRQLMALTTFADLVTEVRARILSDAQLCAGLGDKGKLSEGGKGANAYAEAISVYLAFAVDRMAMTGNSLVRWNSTGEKAQHCFGRQTLSMLWDYAEPNFFAGATGSIEAALFYSYDPLNSMNPVVPGHVYQADASRQKTSENKVISTDPPYYDNIGYADLSDFFYVWLSRSLKGVYPDIFSTIAVPKAEELVATPARHGGKEKAGQFFMDGMSGAMKQLAQLAHPASPITIYYAFKQSEEADGKGILSTGWETFLEAVLGAGFSISGTWPVRTEMKTRQIAMGNNALASSIVIVCRPNSPNLPATTRRAFMEALKAELPIAISRLQAGNIAPVDLAQASIGPGMAIFSRYSKVLGSDGSSLKVRDALMLVNEVLDEQLAEGEGNWDADTRWAVVWFEQYSYEKGDFGQADQLARAKNTSVHGVVEAGVAVSSGGNVRLIKPAELPDDWAPETDKRLTVWEMLHHLIRLQKQGEAAASVMLARLGDKADAAKELAYRLYGICEKKKRSTEGQLYNDLISVWPDLLNQSKQAPVPTARPGEFELDA